MSFQASVLIHFKFAVKLSYCFVFNFDSFFLASGCFGCDVEVIPSNDESFWACWWHIYILTCWALFSFLSFWKSILIQFYFVKAILWFIFLEVLCLRWWSFPQMIEAEHTELYMFLFYREIKPESDPNNSAWLHSIKMNLLSFRFWFVLFDFQSNL